MGRYCRITFLLHTIKFNFFPGHDDITPTARISIFVWERHYRCVFGCFSFPQQNQQISIKSPKTYGSVNIIKITDFYGYVKTIFKALGIKKNPGKITTTPKVIRFSYKTRNSIPKAHERFINQLISLLQGITMSSSSCICRIILAR